MADTAIIRPGGWPMGTRTVTVTEIEAVLAEFDVYLPAALDSLAATPTPATTPGADRD
jgi:hypothetical protein